MKKIEFKIGRKEYLVKDVTLTNYKEVLGMLQDTDVETPYEIVEFLSGCPKETLKEIKFADWYFLWEEVKEMLLGNSTSTDTIVPIIEFQDRKYGLPSIEDLSLGEFADLDIIASGQNSENKLAEIAAILYRPVEEEGVDYIKLEKYSVESMKQRARLFQFLPLSAIKSANTFFLQSASQSLKSILDSSSQEKSSSTLLQDLADLERSLPQDPGGFSLTSFLEKIPSDLMQLHPYLSEQHLTGLLGEKTKLKNNNLI
jgi:hypothetical protein